MKRIIEGTKAYPRADRLANIVGGLVEKELNEYDPNHVDVVKNEDGELDIMYHSEKDSFLILATHTKAGETNLAMLEEILDEFSVGHVW